MNQSAKLKKLQQLLQDHTRVRGVWLDFVSVPQGNNADGTDTYVHIYGQRDELEQEYFQYTLDNIKLVRAVIERPQRPRCDPCPPRLPTRQLYLTGPVLIFVDQMYMGRFWTQFEAFLR